MTVINEENSFKGSIGDDLMQKCLSALLDQHQLSLTGTNSSGKKSVFADAKAKKVPINLDIQTFKIPFALPKQIDRPLHPKINRLKLPHTLTDSSSGVLLVTKDYPKPGNPTISNAHFQKLLTAANSNHLVSEIMSVSQLQAEHSEFESRKELCSRIDVVLCDKAITNIVPRVLGKPFLKAKKFPLAVNMSVKNLKNEFERILSFTAHKMTFRNTQSAVIIGNTAMPEQQLVDNLRCCLEYLSSYKFPGSWENVKTLYLTAGLKGRVPLFVSTASAKDVPNVILIKPEAEVFEGDFGFGNVKVTATGHVLDYVPHPDDEEPIAAKLSHKRRGKSSDANGPQKKKLKTSSTMAEVEGLDQTKKKGKTAKKGGSASDKSDVKKGKKITVTSKPKTKVGKTKAASKLAKSDSKKEGGSKSKKPVGKSSKKQNTLPKAAQIHTTRVETF